ncbi:MAG: sigma 54-interacting transcriptional regulator [Archangium sp.]|nr:sigma 54-interacting transcriptional regulator [Archangium sp.]
MGDDRLTIEVKQLPSSRAAPRWRFKGAGIDFTVDHAARVGAAKGNDLVLDAPTVSRVHAEVLAEPEGVRVRDLGSTNGTRVNGVSISEAVAEPGMKVQFGELALMVERTSQVEEPLAAAARFGRLVGHSAAMRALFHQLEKLAPSNTTVLLQAESGSGKELVARALHDASPRAGGPWVVLDCAGVAPTLLESALFGHEKGAFTGAVARKAGVFEEANGGTLFIDEIGELPLEQQPRLLRALESREVRRVGSSQPIPVDVRVIAATHVDLARAVNEGTFREDLYFRLAVIRLRIPPLRERIEDLPVLLRHLLQELTNDPKRVEAMVAGMSDEQWARLRGYRWRGNVRELRNAVERSLALSQPGVMAPSGQHETPAPSAAQGAPPVALDREFHEQRDALVATFEAAYLRGMLDKHEGNFSRAAAAAGLDRMHFKRLLQKYER